MEGKKIENDFWTVSSLFSALTQGDQPAALQQIGREFPPHYREAIEQYFKRLANGAEDR